MLRVLIGVAIGCTAAVPVGFALAWFPVVREMFNPLVSFFRALPPLALIPLVIVYLGIGETARISVLVYAAFFSAVIVIYESVAAIDDVYVRAGRALGATELELFRRVVVPLTRAADLRRRPGRARRLLGDRGRRRAGRGPARPRRDDAGRRRTSSARTRSSPASS